MFIMTQAIALFACFLVAAANGTEERFVAEPDIPELVQRLDERTRQVSEMNKQRHAPNAFKAHLTGSLIPGPNQRIIYDDVQLNLGNGYQRHFGGFLAPFNGTYMFSLSACSSYGHFIILDLMNSGSSIGKVLAGDSQYADCSSETTITELKQGDQVYVQHHETSGDSIANFDPKLNSFTGCLLQAV